MQRRDLLLSVGGAVALAGCTGGESDESATETPSMTVLLLGEATPDHTPTVRVSDITAATTFDDTYEKRRTVSMPDDEQLVFLSLSIANESESGVTGAYHNAFELVLGETVYTATGGFPHPAYDGAADFDWLARNDDTQRLTAIDDPLEPGETREYWVGYVLPRRVDVGRLNVGFGNLPSAEYRYLWRQ